jgi:fluoride exporter
MKIGALALAGAAGTLARYGLAGWVQRASGGAFPWGTLAVNLTGCFLAGLFWAWAESRLTVTGEWRAIVLIGFMGGFTTFSAFMLETGEMVRASQWAYALGNLGLQNGGGLVGFFLGLFLGRSI